MEQWLEQIAPNAPYLIIIGVLLVSGFGLPVPEDIPLIVGGYLSAMGYANPWIMFVLSFFAIIGADAIVFWLGRRYGHHVPRIPLLRRFLTAPRLRKAEIMLNRHGGKFIFAARFLPGLRTPAMFSAGTFKVPYWKFLFWDGTAAGISAPIIFWLAYAFADKINAVKEWIASGQIIALVTVALAIGVFVLVKVMLKRKVAATNV